MNQEHRRRTNKKYDLAREERLYVGQYNSLMTKVGLSSISRGDELLPASTGWNMKLKEELVDIL